MAALRAKIYFYKATYYRPNYLFGSGRPNAECAKKGPTIVIKFGARAEFLQKIKSDSANPNLIFSSENSAFGKKYTYIFFCFFLSGWKQDFFFQKIYNKF